MRAMKQMVIRFVIVMLLMAASQLCYGQYFQGLYDVDSTYNWGWNIFLQPDRSYFVMGWSYNQNTGQYSIFNTAINGDGNTALSEHILQLNSESIGPGNPGEMKALANGGGYILPLTLQWPDPVTKYLYSAAGFIKYNSVGDTVFLKTYTDTSIHFDGMQTCAIMPDGGYIGGAHALNIPSYYPGNIIRTDSMGDTLWTHTYQKDTAQWVIINNIIPLADGRIVVGAVSIYQIIFSMTGFTYEHYTPWFMVLDSMGNILRDTLYGSQYMMDNTLSGELYNDMNGGYIHTGNYNYLYTSDPGDIQNFPSYIAHLDTNFRITWITPFNFTSDFGHRQVIGMRQLQDSSYMIYGDAWTNYNPGNLGWAAKVSRSGNIVWCKEYFSDSAHSAYFRDMVEKPDGSLVFAGATFNDTLPKWRQNLDVWLVGVDSNGCENPFCAPTEVKNVPKVIRNIEVYPNPTSGAFTIIAPENGTLDVYNIQGQLAATFQIITGSTSLQLPTSMSPGVYVCRYIPEGSDAVPVVIRLVYQP
jgi:type IX secretion system substrate protein